MSSAPSLYLDAPKPHIASVADAAPREPKTLSDLLHEGMYLLLLLRNKYQPADAEDFNQKVDAFFAQFEKQAKRLGFTLDDMTDAKYAFCALLDEVILNSDFSIRGAWELRPLQLRYFGDHLAGENFFVKLEELRNIGAPRIQALEVFYLCLLLGFQGKYVFEGREKLNYLISRLGEEVRHHKGEGSGFAPHWKAPDEIRNIIRHEIPIWVFLAFLALIGLLGFLTLDWMLNREVTQEFAAYQNVIQPYAGVANVTITLP